MAGMGATAKPLEELSRVRLLVPKADDHGRLVAARAEGAIVHVHQVSPSQEAAYMVEIILFNAQGIHEDSHLVDARHSEVEKI